MGYKKHLLMFFTFSFTVIGIDHLRSWNLVGRRQKLVYRTNKNRAERTFKGKKLQSGWFYPSITFVWFFEQHSLIRAFRVIINGKNIKLRFGKWTRNNVSFKFYVLLRATILDFATFTLCSNEQ